MTGAFINQLDARSQPQASTFDDFTTSVANVLVGNTDSGSPHQGVTPRAHLLILQVLAQDNATTKTADMLAAVDAAIREGSQVICLPLGAPSEPSEAAAKFFARAAELGVAVVCPAGNQPTDQPVHPAAYPDCIAAAWLQDDNRLDPRSGFGNWVTIAAPGVGIPVAVGDSGYRDLSGSSYSSAIVAGTIALMRQANEDLSVADIKDIFGQAGGVVLHAGEGAEPTSFRMLDAYAAVRAAGERAQSSS